MAVWDPQGPTFGNELYVTGNELIVAETWIQKFVEGGPTYINGDELISTWANDYFNTGFHLSTRQAIFAGATGPASYFAQYAGVGGSQEFNSVSAEETGFVVSGDYIAGISHAFTGTVFGGYDGLTGVYVSNGKTWNTSMGAMSLAMTDNAVWGPGTLNVYSTRLQYPSGATGAATTFLQSGFTIDGQGKACLVQPGAASAFGTCNLTLSASQLDTSLGTTSGCLNDGFSAVCNFGQLPF